VAKNSAPRIAVARESAFAWPRPVMKLPVPRQSERATLGALQQDHADERDHDQNMNNESERIA